MQYNFPMLQHLNRGLAYSTDVVVGNMGVSHKYTHSHHSRSSQKVKFVPEQATEAQRGSRNIALLFL